MILYEKKKKVQPVYSVWDPLTVLNASISHVTVFLSPPQKKEIIIIFSIFFEIHGT